jgi:uroporphyrinogen decarboxylase
MTSLERTLRFIRNQPVDRRPVHPIIMRWAARYARVPYRDFCLDHRVKCDAMIQCADDFDLDWVTVMSDPYAEAEAFGIQVEYPENDLPKDVGGHATDVAAASLLEPYAISGNRRLENRIEEIREFSRRVGDRLFIVGWVEGPIAEYADLRTASKAALDLYDAPEAVHRTMDVIVASAKVFIEAQVDAGAHCIGIGDAFASQIGPTFYDEFVFARERAMVEHIHANGALAKLHICGDTTPILPRMLQTGADIVDVDHMVGTMSVIAKEMAEAQVLCGKCDPVSVVQDGTTERIEAEVAKDIAEADGRCIVSAGCEITPGTSEENMRALRAAAEN